MILMILFTSVLQVDGSYFPQFHPFHKTLESALTTEETLFTLRQAFFPVVRSSAQETQLVKIHICVEITVDQALNSTTNDSCIASSLLKTGGSNNVSSFCRTFLWTDSALLSLITIDQLIAFDALTSFIYKAATGQLKAAGYNINVFLPILCPVKQQKSEITTSLMLLLSWVRYYSWHAVVSLHIIFAFFLLE